MNRMVLAAALILGCVGSALAQGTSPSGVVHGQNWQLPQDLDNARNPTTAPQGTAADRPARAQRQRRQSQNFPGTGRRVATVPSPTPPQVPVMPSETAPGPAARTRPVPPAAVPGDQAPPRAAATPPVEPGQSTGVARATRSALPAAGQSTGAARGTPASR